jgi:hypothetical protein
MIYVDGHSCDGFDRGVGVGWVERLDGFARLRSLPDATDRE